jgi:hypothetical protein
MANSAPTSWTFTGLLLHTTEEYASSPHSWGTSTKKITWVGNDTARVAAMAAAEAAFDGHIWGSGVAWPAAFKDVYTKILRTYFSLPALRALMLVNGGVGEGDEEPDKDAVIDVCVVGEFPLSTPEYLRGYLEEVLLVAAGHAVGGRAFNGSAMAAADSHAAAVAAAAELADLRASNKRLNDELNRKTADPVQVRLTCTLRAHHLSGTTVLDSLATHNPVHKRPVSDVVMHKVTHVLILMCPAHDQALPPGMDPAMFKQMQMMVAIMAFQQQSKPAGERLGDAVPVPKTKAGWDKILADAKTSIINKESPVVIKLCRAHRDKVKADSKIASGSSRVLLGSGAELLLAGVDSNTVTRTSAVDDPTWSGLNAFFRLFAMMATMTEEEFPRQGLADFLNMWSELWDYSRGTRQNKIKAATAFYDEHADTLGDGTWGATFKTDSLFLFAHLEGANPPLCRACGGSGEQAANARQPNQPGNNATDRGKRKGGTDRDNKRNNGKVSWPCMSMLKQTASCNRATCSFDHPACVSCNGSCASAAKCVDWQQAKVDSTWGSIIAQMEASRRKRPRS